MHGEGMKNMKAIAFAVSFCRNFFYPTPRPSIYRSGAGEGIRTLDINLGKVALYQLSYARID